MWLVARDGRLEGALPLCSYRWAFYRTVVGYILSGNSIVIVGVSCELLRS